MKIGLLCGNSVGHIVFHAIKPKKALFVDWNTEISDKFISSVDVILSVHWRKLIPRRAFDSVPCYNVHPYLYCYPGADPIGRAIKEGNSNASVGIHKVTEIIDKGELVIEDFMMVKLTDYEDIYRQLYPLYLTTIYKWMDILKK